VTPVDIHLPSDETHRVLGLIRRYWGFASLRPLQESAISAALRGHDSLMVLPTGGGKSLCYQVPPLMTGRTDVVVSPLIALMKDQVDGLRTCGYPAAAVHGGMSAAERSEVERELLEGKLRLIFAAPERLLTEPFLRLLGRLGCFSFAIDEAHCISHWGHDFRPEYRRLAALRDRFPSASFHAFTATATKRVRDDIVEQLRLRDPVVLVGSFDRPNLVFRIVPRVDLYQQVLEVVRRHADEAVIIYCLSRRDTEELAEYLRGMKVSAAAYHAGLEAQTRRRVQDDFAAEKVDVVVATVAFGMGIDRSNVRCVIHACVPKSIEHYQQETGRAGRDGLEAECVLFYSAADMARWESLIEKSAAEAERPEEIVAATKELLRHIQRFCSGMQCRHRLLVEYFGQTYERSNCGACDICLGEVEGVEDATVVAQKILSCVARVEERFGVGHVVDVLLGADTEAIRRRAHEQLSTYGLLSDTPRKSLTNYVYQLVDQGLLERTADEKPVLRLNHASWEVMRNGRLVKMVRPKSDPVTTTAVDRDAWEGVDRGLFEHLRKLRKKCAEERSVPAFVIFSDAALRSMARSRPSTVPAFGGISGVGQRKLAEFGDLFTGEIAVFCRDHGLSMDIADSAHDRIQRPDKVRRGPTTSSRRAWRFFEEGRSVEEVVHATGRARSTVFTYLVDFIEFTRPPSIDRWVDPESYRQVADAAAHEDGTRMRPIFERLEGRIPYEIIKLVVVHRKSFPPGAKNAG